MLIILLIFLLNFPLIESLVELPERARGGLAYKKQKEQLLKTSGDDVCITKTYQQQVDHFSSKNTDTFDQRYFVVDKYYKPNAPVFYILVVKVLLVVHLVMLLILLNKKYILHLLLH